MNSRYVSDVTITTRMSLTASNNRTITTTRTIERADGYVSSTKPLVLGEFGIRILLAQYVDEATGKAAAEGWLLSGFEAEDPAPLV